MHKPESILEKETHNILSVFKFKRISKPRPEDDLN